MLDACPFACEMLVGGTYETASTLWRVGDGRRCRPPTLYGQEHRPDLRTR